MTLRFEHADETEGFTVRALHSRVMPLDLTPDDDTTEWCDFCRERGHDIVDCEEREAWHRERTDPDAALRLDPVCRDPE